MMKKSFRGWYGTDPRVWCRTARAGVLVLALVLMVHGSPGLAQDAKPGVSDRAAGSAVAAPPPATLDLEKLLRSSAGKPVAETVEPETAPQPEKAPVRNEIEISSDNMDMDFGARVSTFTGNVVVTEARMKLRAEKMVVFFGQDDKPERIEATGSVIIEQPDADRLARSGRAEYDVIKGMIILTDKPSLSMGSDTLSGATRIVYYRDNAKVTCDSGSSGVRPTITFTPKSQETVPDLLKPTGKDGN
jgi:lipopolysaccharide transport protein LptA